MRKLWVAVGFAAGYVLGSKAGRERYEQIRTMASDFMHTPVVADAQEKVKTLAERGAEAIADKTGLGSGGDKTRAGAEKTPQTPAMVTPQGGRPA